MNRTSNTIPVTGALNWLPVSAEGRAATDRAAFPGGWLYRATAYSADAEPIAVAMAFVPDAKAARL